MAKKATTTPQGNEVRKYNVTLRLRTPLLGTAPDDPEMYDKFVLGKAFGSAYMLAKTPEERAELRRKMSERELAMLPSTVRQQVTVSQQQRDGAVVALAEEPEEVESKGRTVFRRDSKTKALIIMGYQLRGFFKEAAYSHSEVPMIESKIDKYLWVGESAIPIMRNGQPLTEPDNPAFSRPLRIKDQRGTSRTALAVSEVVNPIAETTLTFTVFVMPRGFSQAWNGGKFDEDAVKHWLTLGGAFNGTGQWRSGGHGIFEVASLVEEKVDSLEAAKVRLQMLSEGVQLY